MAHRYYVPDLPDAGTLQLPPEVSHHLAVVLRTQPGAEIALGDGRGGLATGRVVEANRRAVQVAIHDRRSAAPVPPLVQVAFAPPRWQRAEWLLEHGTEVGIDVFRPVTTARTRPLGERLERWQRMVAAAAGQCDRAWLPQIAPPVALTELLEDPGLPEQRWLLEAGSPPLADQQPTGSALLLTGPEGGFTAAELAAIRAVGFRGAGLGPHTLRSETAALVGAAILKTRGTAMRG